MEYALALPSAYLLGSISWGLIAGRVRRGIDVRDYGSGSTGSTNVLRTLGPVTAIIVLLADVAKGVTAVLLAKVLIGTALSEAVAGLLVIAGHNWPLFSRFHGGRGMTVSVGALAVMSPLAAAICLPLFVSTILISRYVSLGSVVALAAAMITIPVLVTLGIAPWEYLLYSSVGGPVILLRHKGNIQRLLNGTESRIRLRPGRAPRIDPDSEGRS